MKLTKHWQCTFCTSICNLFSTHLYGILWWKVYINVMHLCKILIATGIRAQFNGTVCCEYEPWLCCERCPVHRPTDQKLWTEGSRGRKTDLCSKASGELCSTLPLSMILPTMPGKSIEPNY